MSTLTFVSFLANALVTAAHSHMTSYWLLATSLVLLPHSPFPTHHSPLPIPISPSSLPLAHCRKAPSMYQRNPCPICRGASVSQPLTSLPRSLSDHLRSRKRFFPSHNPTTPPPTRTEKHRESHRPNPIGTSSCYYQRYRKTQKPLRLFRRLHPINNQLQRQLGSHLS